MSAAVRAKDIRAYFARLPEADFNEAANRLGIVPERGAVTSIIRAALLVVIHSDDEHAINMAAECAMDRGRRGHPK